MPGDVHITPEGLVEVRRELAELVKVQRPYISGKIRAARQLGDLSENFEYHAAKNEQGFIEARIRELQAIVENAVLIEAPVASDVVVVGSRVRFREEGVEEDEAYRIVGPAEADPRAGRVSYESAVGKALLGRKVGDQVEVRTDHGAYAVRILAIE